MGEELSRKKRVRAGHKGSTTKMIARVEDLLGGTDAPDPLALKQLGMSLREKLEVIKTLDGEILDLVEEGDLADEIDQADLYKEKIYSTLIKIDGTVAAVSRPTSTVKAPVVVSSPSAPPPAHKVRLPKLTIKPFNGNVTTWTTFWDSYRSTIHENTELSDIEKFTYLRSLLTHGAADAISGLTLTAPNYKEAIQILSKRYGNKQQIVNKHMEQLLRIDAVSSQHDVKGLRRLYDTVESNVRNLTSVGVKSEAYGALLSSVLMSKLPAELKLIVSREIGEEEEWKLDALMKIIEIEIRARERSASMESREGRRPAKEHATGAALLTGGATPLSCCFGKQEHPSRDCTNIVDVEARKQALRKSGRCYICLRRNHIARKCRSNIKCTECDGRHHVAVCTVRSRHPTQPSPHSSEPSRGTLNPEAPTYTPSTSDQALWTYSSKQVLLQTATAVAFNPDDPSRAVHVRVVLDTGSQNSYVTDDVRERLSLKINGERPMSIVTFGSSVAQRRVCKHLEVGLRFKDNSAMHITVYSIPTICQPIAPYAISDHCDRFPHLVGLELADNVYTSSALEVGLLIGSDHYWEFLTGRIRRGEEGPVAIETRFGWVLSGPVSNSDQEDTSAGLMTYTLQVSTQNQETQKLDDTLRSFWELESFGIPPSDKTIYDDFCEKIKFCDGRYEVSLPWRDPYPVLPTNFQLCLKRLNGLLARLRNEGDVLKEYNTVIRTQLEQGIVEPVNSASEPDVSGVHYLPHHAVVRKDKETTKLRVVYDASARSNGASLNDCLHAGPKFDQKIFDILLRFRIYSVAFTADIEKAFLMVSLAPEDRDFLRFLWVDDPFKENSELQILRFTRVVFGVSSSPFLLNATVRYHLESHVETHQELVEKIQRSIYVDDIVSGSTSEEEAYTVYSESKKLLRTAGFNLRKFASNSANLQLKVLQEEAGSQIVLGEEETFTQATLGDSQTLQENELKVLGVKWNTAEDQLRYVFDTVIKAAENAEPTKRSIVSAIGRFYDPMGFLSPIVIKFKVFMQALCEAKIGWDEVVPELLRMRWQALVTDLRKATVVTIPRSYLSGIDKNILSFSLCGYCDASLAAYAAVVYLQIETEGGSYMRFVASKTRVSPLKKQSIPRLELLSALLLARLMDTVLMTFKSEITVTASVCFTDSSVALYWIQGVQKLWKPFVQNRVLEIRRLVPVECWRHCPGAENPADIPSRGMSPSEFLSSSLWMNGPSSPPLSVWTIETGEAPAEEFMPLGCQTELRASEKHSTVGLLTRNAHDVCNIVDLEKFSNLNRLVSVVARALRFCSILKKKVNPDSPTAFDGNERELAERLLIKSAQKSLRENRNFKQWEKQLRVFTDEGGVMRCRGRLANAETVSYSSKYPILLPPDHHLTKMYILNAHLKVLHSGVKATVTELRSRFWLVKARSTVKKILRECVPCKRYEGQAYPTPPPPPLPSFRVQEAPPFSHTGVDFAGPLYVKQPGTGQAKVWIALYTCCVTRALHLELVPDMTVTTFLRSFKRFSARRGLPVSMISDNGRTFEAAAKEVDSIFSNPEVERYFNQRGIKWRFNVPRAPWWGGLFERLVRSVKRCLRKNLSKARLSYEELLTALAEVEFVLNSRPLTYVTSSDLEEPLTPSHLIYGRRIMNLPDCLIDDEDEEVDKESLNSRLKYLNHTINSFWKRWRKEYLLELREAHRHFLSNGTPRIAVGDVVVVYAEGQPRSYWKLGIIERLMLGGDSVVRAAAVKVTSKGKTKTLCRPIQHLYPLEVQCSPEEETTREEPVDPEPVDDPEQRSSQQRPRRAAAVQARDRVLAQAIDESQD